RNHELSRTIHRYRRVPLVARRGRVDRKLGPCLVAVFIEPLPVNSTLITVLTETGPCHHELPGIVHRHRRMQLIVVGLGVDGELISQGSTVGTKAACVNPTTRTVLSIAGPGDNELA